MSSAPASGPLGPVCKTGQRAVRLKSVVGRRRETPSGDGRPSLWPSTPEAVCHAENRCARGEPQGRNLVCTEPSQVSCPASFVRRLRQAPGRGLSWTWAWYWSGASQGGRFALAPLRTLGSGLCRNRGRYSTRLRSPPHNRGHTPPACDFLGARFHIPDNRRNALRPQSAFTDHIRHSARQTSSWAIHGPLCWRRGERACTATRALDPHECTVLGGWLPVLLTPSLALAIWAGASASRRAGIMACIVGVSWTTTAWAFALFLWADELARAYGLIQSATGGALWVAFLIPFAAWLWRRVFRGH